MKQGIFCSIRDENSSLSLYRAKIVLVTGPVGSGKTIFLRRLAGLASLPSSINIEWHDVSTKRMIFDLNPPLWLAPTLGEELSFGIHPFPQDAEVHRILSLWRLDALPLNSSVESLDRLQSLRLMLAATELANTNFALLDNPTSSLPIEDAETLRKDISAWTIRSGCSVVIACNRWHDWTSWVQQIWRFTTDDGLPVMESKFA